MFFNFIEYDQPIFRPPSEAESLLIQVTLGCSHNSCTFCGMYRSKKYSVRPLDDILADIKKAEQVYKHRGFAPRKVFICDGDALNAPTEILLEVVKALNSAFPDLNRIGIYVSAKNVLAKSDEELKALCSNNLSIGYLGMESGSDTVLKKINKGNTDREMVESCKRLTRIGWKISVIALLGIGGRELTKEHCLETASSISEIKPNFLSFLTITPVPGTPLFKTIENKKFECLTTKELLKEMKMILSNLSVQDAKVIFRANHVSNLFPLSGIIPRDQERLVATLMSWIEECPEGVYPAQDPSVL